MYFKKLEGERLYLSSIDVNDCEIYAKWMNDMEICKFIKQYTNIITVK